MPEERRLWHVTVTVGGADRDPGEVRAALERLAQEQPFLLSGRYAADRAELRYWEEAADCADAAEMALRLWSEHRASAELPPWQVIGVEILERSLYGDRGATARAPIGLAPAGSWRPLR